MTLHENILRTFSHLVLMAGAINDISFYWMLKTSFLTDSQALEMPPVMVFVSLYFETIRKFLGGDGKSDMQQPVYCGGINSRCSLHKPGSICCVFREKKLFGLIFADVDSFK